MPDNTLTESITKLINQALEEMVFPGAALLVSQKGTLLFCEAFGVADTRTHEKITLNTVFDLASLTKPLATTLAVMKLVQEGPLDLDAEVGDLVLDFKHTAKGKICIKHLLGHTSGLVDYLPYYKQVKGHTIDERKKEVRSFLIHAPLENPIGRTVRYSDLGFMILNWVIETVTQKRLDRFLADEIYGPMGAEIAGGLFFNDLAIRPKRVPYAATEYCPWRNKQMKGEVHDENAYVVGGVDGHAGLFGNILPTYDLLFKLLCIYHGELSNPVFLPRTIKSFWAEQNHTRRTLGFDMPSVQDSSAGRYFSKNSIGHLGYTGTSFWVDVDQSIIVILLSNRVHPTRENVKIKSFRPKLHDTIMELIL